MTIISDIIQHEQFGSGVSDDLGRQIFGGLLKTPVARLLLGTRMNLSDPMLDLLLVQWALGSLWCGKMSCPVWPECEGSSWISKAWMPLLALMFARPKSNWAPLEYYLLLHMTLQNCTTDYPTAHWCLDPYVRGDPPGSHPPSHKKHAQMLLKTTEERGGHINYFTLRRKFDHPVFYFYKCSVINDIQ